jgi:hypothetical protein
MADTIPTPGEENAADPTDTSAEVGPADVDASAIPGVDPNRPPEAYFGHALIAEGLVSFTYTADEASRWWKAGGYGVLGGAVADAVPTPRGVSVVPAYGGDMNPAVREGQQPSVPAFSNAAFVIDPNGEAPLRPGPAVLFDEKPAAFDRAAPLNDDGSGAETGMSDSLVCPCPDKGVRQAPRLISRGVRKRRRERLAPGR